MNIWLKILPAVLIPFDVQSKKLVEKTSCLELAKPSNQQFRLTCSQHLTYHCLLDETFTKEFEVCREWKWIPEGNCAYFNTYGEGNIDGRPCVISGNVVCPTRQYSSAENTKYTACYVKKMATILEPRTRIPHVTSTGAFEGGNSTYFPKLETKRPVWALPIGFVIVISVILLAMIAFFFGRWKCFQQLRTVKSDNEEEDEKVSSETFNEVYGMESSEVFIEEYENELSDVFNDAVEIFFPRIAPPSVESTFGSDLYTRDDDGENEEVSTDMLNDTIDEEKSAESTFGSVLYTRVDNEENEESTDVFNDTIESLQGIAPPTADYRLIGDEEKSAESTFGSVLYTRVDDEENDESTDVFNDTIESLQGIAPPTVEQGRELCTELHNLLEIKGLKLIQNVMTTAITRMTKTSVEELVGDERNFKKLKEILPEESYRILVSKYERDMSIHVLYGLHRIFLDEEQSPKSGWGNPVRGTDIGTGDDVERLYRIQNIVHGISNPVTVSVESYIRLLDIMIEALTRLDPGAEFKEDYKLLSSKLESTKNPNFTQTMFKKLQIW